jgi:hypothetical protein
MRANGTRSTGPIIENRRSWWAVLTPLSVVVINLEISAGCALRNWNIIDCAGWATTCLSCSIEYSTSTATLKTAHAHSIEVFSASRAAHTLTIQNYWCIRWASHASSKLGVKDSVGRTCLASQSLHVPEIGQWTREAAYSIAIWSVVWTLTSEGCVVKGEASRAA